LTDARKEVRDWMFRGLMFEAEATRFRAAGIRLGADDTELERSMLEETLSPFSVDLRNNALQMSRLYALVYCFENAVRDLIKARLEEKYELDWCQRHPCRCPEARREPAKGCGSKFLAGCPKSRTPHLHRVWPSRRHHHQPMGSVL